MCKSKKMSKISSSEPQDPNNETVSESSGDELQSNDEPGTSIATLLQNVDRDDDDDDYECSDMSEDSEDNDDDDEDDVDVINKEIEDLIEDGSEDEDDVVKAIKQEREKPREHPPDIQFDDQIVDISCHPHLDLIAAATISGDVIFHKYSLEKTELVNTLELHTKACRDIEFSKDGELLFSSSKDKCIMITDANTGKLKANYDNAHEDAIYSLLIIDEHQFASGDDSGTVKLWDLRKPEPVFSLKEMDDYVTSMITNDAKKYLVCASGEGCITTLNLRARKLHVQSEMYESEFTCMGLMRRDTKLLVGSSSGKLYLYNWDEFGYHSDMFPGPKFNICALVPITENIVVTASDDGRLRATHLFPHRHLGVVGQHQSPLLSLDISGDGHYLASSGYDQKIKFWNIQYFEDLAVEPKEKTKKRKEERNLPSSKFKDADDFFSGLA